jgi:hypothetical protein
MAADGGRKSAFRVSDPHCTRRASIAAVLGWPLWLRSWDVGIESSDTSSGVREPSREIRAERLRAGRNGEGYEDDKHGIFGGSGSALVTAQPGNQIRHLTSPLRKWSAALLPVNVTGNRYSANAQPNQTPSARCPMRRQKTVFDNNFSEF